MLTRPSLPLIAAVFFASLYFLTILRNSNGQENESSPLQRLFDIRRHFGSLPHTDPEQISVQVEPSAELAENDTASLHETSTVALQAQNAAVETPALRPLNQRSPYAYVFHASDSAHACSVLVSIDRLRNVLGTRHRIFVLVTAELDPVYVRLFKSHGAIVSVQAAPRPFAAVSGEHAGSALRLLAFKMHQIDPTLRRVLALDADQLVMQSLDHLLEGLPETDLAVPRAYWFGKHAISSNFMMITLSDRLWNTVEDGLKEVKTDKSDMDFVNDLLGNTAMVLPGRYATLSNHWQDWTLPEWFHEPEIRQAIAPAVAKAVPQKPCDESTTNGKTRTDCISPVEKPVLESVRKMDDDVPKVEKRDEWQGLPHDLPSPEDLEPLASDDFIEWLENTDARTAGHKEPLPRSASSTASVSASSVSSEPLPTASTVDAVVISPPEEGESSPSFNTLDPELIGAAISKVSNSTSASVKIEERPLYNELFDLYSASAVVQITALGKPWELTLQEIGERTPDAHPVLAWQVRTWRETAVRVCPAGIVDKV